MVYEITERTMSADGQMFVIPDVDINMYWTSLDVSDEDVIELYHNHAVCEQFHSEIKTDMGIERLSSGKFETNALILKLAMIAYNVLRIIGTEAMKKQDMSLLGMIQLTGGEYERLSLTKETHTELAALEFHKITLLRLSIQIGRRDFYTL